MSREERTIATNKKAFHDYFVDETFEAGIVLTGTEVKSLRENKANLRDSFATVRGGEVWLHGVHISPYSHGNRSNVDSDRPRKLLLRRGWAWTGGKKMWGQGHRLWLRSLRFEDKEDQWVLDDYLLALDHTEERLRALDAQIAEIFAQALPGQPVVDPRAQMQGALGAGGSAGGGLLPAMSVIAQAMAQAPAARLRSISFRNNVIELNLTAPSIESLDGIKQGMNRDGITAEIQSANPNGPVVDGRLQLRLGPA